MSKQDHSLKQSSFGLGFRIKAVVAFLVLLLASVAILSFLTLQRFNDQLTLYSNQTLPALAASIDLNNSLERVVQNAEQLVTSNVQAQRRIAYTATRDALYGIETMLESRQVLLDYEEINTVLVILGETTTELNQLIETKINLAARLEMRRKDIGNWVVEDLIHETTRLNDSENEAYQAWLDKEHALVEQVINLATNDDFRTQQRLMPAIQRTVRSLQNDIGDLPGRYQEMAASRLEGLNRQLTTEGGLVTTLRELSQVDVRARALERQMRVLVAELLRNTDRLASERSAEAQSNAQTMASQSEQQLAVMFASVAVAIAIGFFSFFYIERRMLAPLSALREAVISRASGGTDPLPELGDDEVGEISAAVQYFVDEIDRRQLQLMDRAEQINSIVRLSPQPMCIADGQEILYFNEAFARLWRDPRNGVVANEDTILDLFPQDLLNPGDNDGVRSVARHAIQGRNGVTRWFSMTSSPVEWHGRKAFQLIAVDNTKQVQVEHTLQEARRRAEAAAQAKANFLAMMSHEIRSPMNGIISVGEMLGKSKLEPEQSQLVTVINQSAETLLTILDDVLDLSKIEAGKLEISPHNFVLPDLINGVANLLKQSFQRKGIDFTVNLDEDLPVDVVGDSNRIRQIMYNLLSNALKFTEKGAVTINASSKVNRQGKHTVRLEVADTGIGINPKVMARLFQPFEQADSSVARQYGGTGLGLTICRRLANLMDGEILVKSKEVEGSTFTLEITLAERDTEEIIEQTPSQEAASDLSDKKTRILVVEDNKINQLVIGKILKSLGYEWDTADDGKNALSIYDPAKHDLILTDLRMPRMDGFALASAIRAREEEGTRIPIVAISADAMEEARERSVESGIDRFLTKPVRVDDVKECLEAFGR